MVSSISQRTGSSLFDALRSMQKEQAEALEESLTEDLTSQAMSAANHQSISVHAAPSNLMSRNFAGGRENDSKYVDAQMAGLKASKQMNLSQAKTMTSVLDAFGGIAGPSLYGSDGNTKSGGGATEHEVRRYLEQRTTKKLMEEKQEELQREKEAQRAAESEALSSGEMIAVDSASTGAHTIPATESVAAPMPEISGSNPAPAPTPGVSTAPAPDVAVVATSAPEVSTPSAPSTVSIDITV